jgi:hypothetical protein
MMIWSQAGGEPFSDVNMNFTNIVMKMKRTKIIQLNACEIVVAAVSNPSAVMYSARTSAGTYFNIFSDRSSGVAPGLSPFRSIILWLKQIPPSYLDLSLSAIIGNLNIFSHIWVSPRSSAFLHGGPEFSQDSLPELMTVVGQPTGSIGRK